MTKSTRVGRSCLGGVMTRVEGSFAARGYTWEYRWLADDVLSVLQHEPAIDDSGTDQTDWPSDEEISTAVGRRVKFSDAGDHPTAVEAIYHAKALLPGGALAH